jgi:hypothetical protein
MIDAFHAEVDALAGKLEREHRGRLQCQRGCAACCVDDISVFEVEAARIVRDHALLLSEGEPHAVGACAFLDEEGACRIYAARPYGCRTQGLPLRWIDDAAEYRDICTLNEDGPLITDLKPTSCWTLGPAEAKLQALQAAHGEPMKRVSLRTLFERSPS